MNDAQHRCRHVRGLGRATTRPVGVLDTTEQDVGLTEVGKEQEGSALFIDFQKVYRGKVLESTLTRKPGLTRVRCDQRSNQRGTERCTCEIKVRWARTGDSGEQWYRFSSLQRCRCFPMVLRVFTIGDCPDRWRSPIFERNEQSREASRDVSFMPKSPATFQMLCETNGLSAGAAYYAIALAYFWT